MSKFICANFWQFRTLGGALSPPEPPAPTPLVWWRLLTVSTKSSSIFIVDAERQSRLTGSCTVTCLVALWVRCWHWEATDDDPVFPANDAAQFLFLFFAMYLSIRRVHSCIFRADAWQTNHDFRILEHRFTFHALKNESTLNKNILNLNSAIICGKVLTECLTMYSATKVSCIILYNVFPFKRNAVEVSLFGSNK